MGMCQPTSEHGPPGPTRARRSTVGARRCPDSRPGLTIGHHGSASGSPSARGGSASSSVAWPALRYYWWPGQVPPPTARLSITCLEP